MLLEILKKTNLIDDKKKPIKNRFFPDPNKRRVINAPESLCIYSKQHLGKTMLFFDLLTKSVFNDFEYLTLDFSNTKTITAAASLMLFAHITRCQNCAPSELFKFRDRVIIIDFKKNKLLLDFFKEITLFEATKPGGQKKLDHLWENDNFYFKTHNNASKKASEIIKWLHTFNYEIPLKMSSAINEALLNISHHAYSKFKSKDNPLDAFMDGRWWQFGWITKDHINNASKFYFLIYDMGSGIPELVKEKSTLKKHSDMIKLAMTRGWSSTGISGRGNGSHDLIKLLESRPPDDSLLIYSNNGLVRYGQYQSVVSQEDLPMSTGGTLIQWCFEVEERLS